MPKFGQGTKATPATLLTGGYVHTDDFSEDFIRDVIGYTNSTYELKFSGSRKERSFSFWVTRTAPGTTTDVTTSGGGAPHQRYVLNCPKSSGGINLARLKKGEIERWEARGHSPVALQIAVMQYTLDTLAARMVALDDQSELQCIAGIKKNLEALAALEQTHFALPTPEYMQALSMAGRAVAEARDFLKRQKPALPGGTVSLANKYIDHLETLLVARTAAVKQLDDARKQPPPAAPAVPVPAAVVVPAVGPGAAPLTPLEVRINSVTAQCQDICGPQLRSITHLRSVRAQHSNAQTARWVAAEAELSLAKLTTHGQIEKALTEISALMSAVRGEPAPNVKLTQLAALRSALIHTAVTIEFPILMPDPLVRADVGDSLVQHVAELAATAGLADAADVSKDIAFVIEALNTRDKDFTPQEALAFLEDVQKQVDALEPTAVQDGQGGGEYVSPRNMMTLKTVKTQLDQVTELVRARIAMDGVSAALQGVDYSPSELLRAIRWSLPIIDMDSATSHATLRQNAQTLEHVCKSVVAGLPPNELLGYSAALDDHLLALKQERALRDAPDPTKADEVRKAVALRQELTLTYAQLDRLLKIRPSASAQGAPFRIGRDTEFVTKLRSNFGKQATRDVAFLLVRIADLELRTLELEQRALGKHTDISLDDYKLKQQDDSFAYAGISDADLKRLRLDPTDRVKVHALMVELSRAGVGSIDQAKATNRAIQKTIEKVFEHQLAQDHFLRLSPKTAAGLGKIFLQEMLDDAKMSHDLSNERSIDLSTPPKIRDPEICETFKTVNRNIESRVKTAVIWNNEDGWETLRDESRSYRAAERAMIPLLAEFDQLEAVAAFHRNRLAELQAEDKLSPDVDPTAPMGLRSAQRILEALSLDEQLGHIKADRFEDPNKAALKATFTAILGRVVPDAPSAGSFPFQHHNLLTAEEDALVKQLGPALELLSRDGDLTSAEKATLTGAIEAASTYTLDKLRSLDTQSMHRSWRNRLALAVGMGPKALDMATLKALKEPAESILYLRQTDPKEKARISAHVKVLGKQMDDLLAARMRRHPEEIVAARQLIRAAILAHWPTDKDDFTLSNGQVLEGYNPADKRDEIKTLLKEWGLDAKRFGPELDKELYGTLTKLDVRRWYAEANFAVSLGLKHKKLAEFFGVEPEYGVRHRKTTTMGSLFGLDSFTAKRKVDAPVKRALLEQVRALKPHSRIMVRSGLRLALDSGRVPLDPSGANTLEVKLTGSGLATFEIQRGVEGYSLHMRSGGEGKLNADYRLAYRLDKVFIAQAAAAGVETSVAHAAGETVVFPDTPAGLEALLALLSKMLDGEPINVSDWAPAHQLAHSTETIGKLGGSSTVGMRVEAMHFLENGDQKFERIGVGVNAEAFVTAQVSGKSTNIDNLNQSIHKGECDIRLRVGVNNELYVRTANALNSVGHQAAEGSGASDALGPNYNSSAYANSNLISHAAMKSAMFKRKWKQVTDDQGFYTSAVIVHQTTVRMDQVLAYYTVANPEMIAIMDKNPEFARNLRSLIKVTRPDDMISVRYELTPTARLHANELIRQANALSAAGTSDSDQRRARALRAQAKAIAEDFENHRPARVGVVLTTSEAKEVNLLMSHWVQYSGYSDGRLEHLLMTIDVPHQDGEGLPSRDDGHAGAYQAPDDVTEIYPALAQYARDHFVGEIPRDPALFFQNIIAALGSEYTKEDPGFRTPFEALLIELDHVRHNMKSAEPTIRLEVNDQLRKIDDYVASLRKNPAKSAEIRTFVLAVFDEVKNQRANHAAAVLASSAADAQPDVGDVALNYVKQHHLMKDLSEPQQRAVVDSIKAESPEFQQKLGDLLGELDELRRNRANADTTLSEVNLYVIELQRAALSKVQIKDRVVSTFMNFVERDAAEQRRAQRAASDALPA